MFEGFLAPSHLLIVAIIALLLFGDRLPEVMRSVGKGMMEFKKGLRGIENAIEAAATAPPNRTAALQNQSADAASRFDSATPEPRAEGNSTDVSSHSPPAPHAVEHHAETAAHEAAAHEAAPPT